MKNRKDIKLIESPRDAMQGIHDFIDTDLKIEYINSILEVGFDTIDFGSFVSPKAIPQMRDTAEVLAGLNLNENSSKLLSIIANVRGANDASEYDEITYLGYPFSISETFQLRNTNANISKSLHRVEEIKEICDKKNKELLIYISMGFGNPYGDEWNVEIVQKWVDLLYNMGIKIFALSDTIGVSNPMTIKYLFENLIPHYEDVEFGAHLHTQPHNWEEKIDAAYQSGCIRFDSAIKGYGGCPMAKDELTGNMATERVLQYFNERDISLGLDQDAFKVAMEKKQQSLFIGMDEKKYKDVFYTYYNPLVNYAAQLFGNHKEAQDVVQDVFVQLWEKRSSIDESTVKSYLFAATKNHIYDVFKRNKHHEKYKSFLEQKDHQNEEIIDNYLLKEKINHSLRQLPPKCREIFILSKTNGLTYQEIADHLDISKKTVENQMSKALKLLREILKDQEFYEFR